MAKITIDTDDEKQLDWIDPDAPAEKKAVFKDVSPRVEKRKDEIADAICKAGDPFAICTAALGEQHTPRWERCVQSLKERLGVETQKSEPQTKEEQRAEAAWELQRAEVLPALHEQQRFSLQRCNKDHVLRLGTDRAGGALQLPGTFGFSLPLTGALTRELGDLPVVYKGLGPAFWVEIEKEEQVGPVKVEVLDAGDWSVEKISDDEIVLQLLGKVLKGYYELRKSADGRWHLSGPISDRYQIIRQSPEQRYSLGVAYPANKLDAHADKINPDQLERAAWSYMARGEGRRIGLMHKDGTDGAGTVVESYIYRGPEWKVGDQVIKSGDWLLGVVWNDDAWGQIKKGAFTGYSIQGWAQKS
jgi:hypothetical protein